MKPYYEHGGITIYHGDCRDVLPTLPQGSIDVAITDPPYVFGIKSIEGKSGWPDLMNASAWYASWLCELNRICKDITGSAWVFNSWRSFPILARAAYDAEWPIESLAVWDKDWIGPGGTRGLRPSYELIALFVKPGFSLVNRGMADVIRFKWMSNIGETEHKAEKPVPLISRLLRETNAASVIDPFLGSGTTLVAAKRLRRSAIGIEAEEKWCEVAARRLEDAVLDFGPEPVVAQPEPNQGVLL